MKKGCIKMSSPSVLLAIDIQRSLQEQGFYVSRHSSSMLVMYNDKLIATIHVYVDECIINNIHYITITPIRCLTL